MSERDSFVFTRDTAYPFKKKLILTIEDYSTLNNLPSEVFVPDITHMAVTIGVEEGQDPGFYEESIPLRKQRTPIMSSDKYLTFLGEENLPDPPEEWKTQQVIYVANKRSLIELPEVSEDEQGRIVTFKQQSLLPVEGEVYIARMSASNYINTLYDKGFPHEVITLIKENTENRSAYPDGELLRVIRTNNTRPDIRRQK